jgi:hypothetical protein
MAVVMVAALPACALSASGEATDEQEAGSTTYVDIADFPGIDQGAWFDLGGKLATELATAEPGVTALTFNCSVTSKLGSVHDCAWTLADARSAVDPGTAAISVDAVTYACHVHPRTTAPKLLALLAGSADALHEPLPGIGSIADTLADCFAHPIGGTPLPPAGAGSTYVDASAYYATAANQAKWQATADAFVRGFDDICGDTFCGGDFGDLRSLELACAITKSTGNVKGCAWVFAGSYSLPAKTGALDVTSRTFRCDVAVHGTLSQLITTLTAPGSDNPIQRPLPGGTASAYDALGGCLP